MTRVNVNIQCLARVSNSSGCTMYTDNSRCQLLLN